MENINEERNAITEVLADEEVNKRLDELNVDFEHMSANTLTNEEIDDILAVVGAIDNPDEALYEQATKLAAEDHEDDFNDTGIATINHDPVTGINTISIDVEEAETRKEIQDFLDNLELDGVKAEDIEPYEWHNTPEEDAAIEATALENVVKGKSDEYNLSTKDTLDFMNLINNWKQGIKDVVSVYDCLPPAFQEEIDETIRKGGGKVDRATREQISRMFIDGILSDVELEKQFVDFQQALNKELNIPDIMDIYSEVIKEQVEVDMAKKADELEEAGEVEKAEKIRKVIQSFKDSYTYSRILDGLENNPKIRNRITKDLPRYKRFCEDINYKMKDSEFIIKDTFQMAEALAAKLDDEYTIEDIQKFVIAFAKTCDTMSKDRIEDCAYIYYTIRNIVNLSFIDEANTEFSKQIINNVQGVIDRIREVEQQRLAMKEEHSKSKKKRG